MKKKKGLRIFVLVALLIVVLVVMRNLVGTSSKKIDYISFSWSNGFAGGGEAYRFYKEGGKYYMSCGNDDYDSLVFEIKKKEAMKYMGIKVPMYKKVDEKKFCDSMTNIAHVIFEDGSEHAWTYRSKDIDGISELYYKYYKKLNHLDSVIQYMESRFEGRVRAKKQTEEIDQTKLPKALKEFYSKYESLAVTLSENHYMYLYSYQQLDFENEPVAIGILETIGGSDDIYDYNIYYYHDNEGKEKISIATTEEGDSPLRECSSVKEILLCASCACGLLIDYQMNVYSKNEDEIEIVPLLETLQETNGDSMTLEENEDAKLYNYPEGIKSFYEEYKSLKIEIDDNNYLYLDSLPDQNLKGEVEFKIGAISFTNKDGKVVKADIIYCAKDSEYPRIHFEPFVEDVSNVDGIDEMKNLFEWLVDSEILSVENQS